ncbi:MAG: transketolase family protein [Brevinematia bacterium]
MFEKKSLRDAFGETLVELGVENQKVVVLSADLEDSTRTELFKKRFPDRFFTLGIAEQDMVGTAAGLARMGFIPFVSSFAVFLTNQAYGIIRMSCYNGLSIKFVATHAGLTVGEDGASAQSLEDIAIMRVLPGMKVIVPSDAVETRKVIRYIAAREGSYYVRLSRAEFPVVNNEDFRFEEGKGYVLSEGRDATIIACGLMVYKAIMAKEILKREGIECRVVNLSSIKPIDVALIVDSARKTGCIVTAEEHQLYGGMGSAVSEVLAKNYPVPQEFVAVMDSFGESGSPDELLFKYNLTENNICGAVRKAIERKKYEKK